MWGEGLRILNHPTAKSAGSCANNVTFTGYQLLLSLEYRFRPLSRKWLPFPCQCLKGENRKRVLETDSRDGTQAPSGILEKKGNVKRGSCLSDLRVRFPRVNSYMCLTPVSHRRPRKPQDTLLRSFGLLALRLLANSLAWRTHPLLPFQLLRSSPRGSRLRMRTDAPTGPAWEEGREMRLGPAAARAPSFSLPSLGARRVVQLPSIRRQRCSGEAAKGGARSPAPREGPSAGEGAGVRTQTPGSLGSGVGPGRHSSRRRTHWGPDA